jgi:hypothetical protein
MRVFSTLMPRSNENKSCTRVDESWEARVCMRVFSTLIPRSNENKSCMRVDESWEATFAWKFSQLSCPGQTRTRVAWELMRVDWILPRAYAETFIKTLIKIWTSSKWRECMRVDESLPVARDERELQLSSTVSFSFDRGLKPANQYF